MVGLVIKCIPKLDKLRDNVFQQEQVIILSQILKSYYAFIIVVHAFRPFFLFASNPNTCHHTLRVLNSLLKAPDAQRKCDGLLETSHQ